MGRIPSSVYERIHDLYEKSQKEGLSSEETVQLITLFKELKENRVRPKTIAKSAKVPIQFVRSMLQSGIEGQELVRWDAGKAFEELKGIAIARYKEHVREEMVDILDLAFELYRKYYPIASAKGKSVLQYVTEGLVFYEKFAPLVEQLLEVIEEQSNLISDYKKLLEQDLTKVEAMRLIKEFTTDLINLKLSGKEINPDWINMLSKKFEEVKNLGRESNQF